MIRNTFAAMFGILAVAASPLWFWFVAWGTRNQGPVSVGVAWTAFFGTILMSGISVAMLATLAALAWRPDGERGRAVKGSLLRLCGSVSFLVGWPIGACAIAVYIAMGTEAAAFLAAAAGASVLTLAVGFAAYYELGPSRAFLNWLTTR